MTLKRSITEHFYILPLSHHIFIFSVSARCVRPLKITYVNFQFSNDNTNESRVFIYNKAPEFLHSVCNADVNCMIFLQADHNRQSLYEMSVFPVQINPLNPSCNYTYNLL
jgi:hypothetical protein